MTSKTSKLFSCVDHAPESGSVFKSVVWSDDYVEIICKQPSTERSKTFRISAALVSAMIQQYYFDLDLLWKELCECVQFYSDSILFSTQHAFYYPIVRDNKGRSAFKIYQMSKFVDGEPESWLIEFFANTDYPFDLEIAVKRTMSWDQWYYYRIEAPYLKPYFEKYCLEMFAKSKKSITTNLIINNSMPAESSNLQQSAESNNNLPHKSENTSDANPSSAGETTVLLPSSHVQEKDIDHPPKPNFMLEAIADELLFDQETSKLLMKSIEILKLQDYIDRSVRNHKDKDHHSDFVSDNEDENSDKFSHLSPLNSPEHHFIKINDDSSQLHSPTPRTTTLYLNTSSPHHVDDDNQSVITATDRSQLAAIMLGELQEQRPPPIEKYSQSIHMPQEKEFISILPHHVSFTTDSARNDNHKTNAEKDVPMDPRNSRVIVTASNRLQGGARNLLVSEDVIEVPTLISPKFVPMSPDGFREQLHSEHPPVAEPTPRLTTMNISPLMARIAKDLNVNRGREYINISELMEHAQHADASSALPTGNEQENHRSVSPHADTLPQPSSDILSAHLETHQTDQPQSHMIPTNDPHAPPKLTVTQQLAMIEKQPVAPYTPRKGIIRSSCEFHSPEEIAPADSVDAEQNKQVNNRLLSNRRGRSSAAANTNATATNETSKQARLRKEFLQTHNAKNAFVYESNIEKVQEQISQMVEDNKLLILKAKQEADLLMRSPLNQQGAMLLNKAQTVNASSAHSEGISNDMKMAIVRDALSLRPDLRSTMSTKAIVEFLQAQCPTLAVHMKLSSWDDLVAISQGASLVEVRKMDPNINKEEEEPGNALESSSLRMDKVKGQDLSGILGIQKGQIIANLYVVLQGSITVEWQEEDNEAKLKELFRGRNANQHNEDEDDEDEDTEPDEDNDDDEEEENGHKNETNRSALLVKQFSRDTPAVGTNPISSGNLPSFVRQHSNNARVPSMPPARESVSREISNRSIPPPVLNKRNKEDDEDDEDDNDSDEDGDDDGSLHTLPADNDQSTAVTTIRTMETPYVPKNAKVNTSANVSNGNNNDNDKTIDNINSDLVNKPRNPWGMASLNQFKMPSVRNIDVEDIVVSAKKKEKPHYALAKSHRSHHSNHSNGPGSASKDSHGQSKDSSRDNRRQSRLTSEDTSGKKKNLVTRRQVLVNGSVIGENVFRGEYLYTYNVVQYSPDAQVCQIPVIAFEHFVGRSGKDVEEYLVHFWKRLRLWILIKEYNKALVQQNLYEIKFKQIMAHGGGGGAAANRRDHRQPKVQVMNVIDSGRIRTYHAGEVVFAQDTPRHYMYIIKQGITKYFRDFQPKSTASPTADGKDTADDMSWLKDIVPPRVETTVFYNALDDALKKKAFTSTKTSPRPSSSGYGNQPFHEKNSLKNNADKPHSIKAKETDMPKVDPWEEPRVNPGAEDHGGGILLTHDFSFLDSEQADIFLPYMAEMDKKFLGNIGQEEEEDVDEEGEMLLSPEAARERKLKKQLDALYQESERAQEYRRQKYARFGRHRNTLIATTRCEICVIQLSEIVKCYPLFQTLFKLANDRYPGLLVSNEQVVRNYHYQQEWLRQKPMLLQEVAQEQLHKLLYEDIHHELGNYESEHLYDSRKPGLQHLRVQGKMASVQQRQWELEQGETEKSQLLMAAKAKDTDRKPGSPNTRRSSSPPSLSLEEPQNYYNNNHRNFDSPPNSPLSSKFSSPTNRSRPSSPFVKRPKSAFAVASNSRRQSYQSKRDSFSTRDAESIVASVKSSVSGVDSHPETAPLMDFGYKQILNNAIRMFGGRKRGQNKSPSPDNRRVSLFSVNSLASSVPMDRSIAKSQDSTQTLHLPSWSISDPPHQNHHTQHQVDHQSQAADGDVLSTKSDANSSKRSKSSSVSQLPLDRIHEDDKGTSHQPLKIDPVWIAYAAKQHEAYVAKQETAATHRPFATDTHVPAKVHPHVVGSDTSLEKTKHSKKKTKNVPQLQFAMDNVPEQLKVLSEMDFSGTTTSHNPPSSHMNNPMEVDKSTHASTTAGTAHTPSLSTSKRPFSANASAVTRPSKGVDVRITADVQRLPVTYTTQVGPPMKTSTAASSAGVDIGSGMHLLAPHKPTQSRPSSANASVRGTSHRTFLKQQQQQTHVVSASQSQKERSRSPPIHGSERTPRGASRVDPMTGRPISGNGRPRSAANAPIKLRPEDYADLYRAHIGGQLSSRSMGGAGQPQQHHDLSADLAVLRAQDREKVNQIRIRHESLLIEQEQYDLKRLAAESRAQESSEEEEEEEEAGSHAHPMDDSSTVRSGGRQSVRSGQSRGSTASRGSVGGQNSNSSAGSSRRGGGSIRGSVNSRSSVSVGHHSQLQIESSSSGGGGGVPAGGKVGNRGSVGSSRPSASRGNSVVASDMAGTKKNSVNVNVSRNPSVAAAAGGGGGGGVELNAAPKYLDDFFRRFQS